MLITHHLKTTVEKMSNVSDNLSGASFPNPLMSVKNVFNFDAHSWPKNTILIAGDSMINSINVKRFSTHFKSVKARFFSSTTIDNMGFNPISFLRKKPAVLVLHVATNNSTNETWFQIYNKLLDLV